VGLNVKFKKNNTNKKTKIWHRQEIHVRDETMIVRRAVCYTAVSDKSGRNNWGGRGARLTARKSSKWCL